MVEDFSKAQKLWVTLDEEDVFWKGYCEIEQTKTAEFSLTGGPQSLLRRLWANVDMIFNPDQGKNENKFRMHYIMRTHKVAVLSLVTNITILSLMCYAPIVADKAHHGVANQYKSRESWALYNGNWLVISFLYLGYYALFYLDKQQAVFRLFHSDVVSALEGLGRAVLMGRMLILLQALGIFTHHEGTCTELDMLSPADHSFGLILSKITFDFLEVCALVLIPIPRSYIFRLCLVESIGQSARLLTCTARLDLGDGFERFFWTIVAIIVPMYMCIVALPAITLGHTMKASYQHRLRLEEASAEKKSLVNMFCTDLKVPVQQTKQLLHETSIKLSQKETDSLEGGLASITAVVDHIVFVMRVHEGRFTYSHGDIVDMPHLTKETLRGLVHSSGIGREDVFDMDVPNIRLCSNKNALSALLFYSMNAALIQWKRTKRSPRAAHGIGLGVAILPNGNRTDLVCSVYRKSRGSNEGGGSGKSSANSRGKDALSHYQTCLMFCELVAGACHGSFEHSDGFMRFTIPVEHPQLAVHLEAGNMSLNPFRKAKLPSSIIKEMAVYSADPSLSSLVMQALRIIVPSQHIHDLRVFSQLNMADMHVRSIVLVTSLQACLELRVKRYMGNIILMSDRLAYLDDKDRQTFDHAVSIPCDPLQMEELVEWIEDKANLATVVHSPEPASEQKLVNHCCWITWTVLAVPHTLLKWLLAPAVTPIGPTRMLNYLRWKFLNPSASTFHHTNNIEIMFFFTIFMICLSYMLYPDQHMSGIVSLVPFSVPFVMRRLNVQRVSKHGQLFHWCIWAMGFVLVMGAFINVYVFAFDAVNGHPLSAAHAPTAHTGKEFLENNYGATAIQSGQRLVIGMLGSVAVAKVFAEILIWPYNLWGVLAQVIVPLIIVGRLMQPFLAKAAVIFVVWALIFTTLFIVVILIYTENLRRKEFLQLREFILSRDFLERSITACWRDTMCPLKILTTMQESILAGMAAHAVEAEKDAISENKTHLSTTLLAKIEKVCLNLTLSKELLVEMQMSLQATTPRDGATLIANMEVHLLRPIIRRVASLFTQDSDALCIKFHLHIHPTLMLVRCDKTMLEAMLCSTCRSAVERITTSVYQRKLSGQSQPVALNKEKVSVTADVSSVGLVHEVLLSLQPGPGQMDLRFTDIHTMHLMVYDTSQTPNKQHCFMKSLYERYMKAHGQLVVYEFDLPATDPYINCQRIALPYKLCPSTPKVAAYFPVLHQHIEPIAKAHLTHFKQYEEHARQQIALQVCASTHKQKVKLDMPLPNLDLTLLCHEMKRTHNRGSDMVSLDDAITCGLDRKLVYLRTGVMPNVLLIRSTSCFLIDQQLCIANAVLNRQFLQELILYLRANDFLGIIGLVTERNHDDYEDDDGFDCLRGYDDEQIIISADSWHNEIAGYNKQVVDGMGPEVTFDLGLDAKRLLCLREMCESRLVYLTIPHLL